MTTQLPLRSEVPAELTWDLTLLYADDEAMQKALKATAKKAQHLATFKGQITTAKQLATVLTLAKEIDEELEKEYVYAFLRRDSDTTDATATALFGQAAQVATQIETQLAFIDPEILALSDEQLADWQANEPALAEFEFQLTSLQKQKAHVLAGEQERLLSRLNHALDGASEIYNTLNDADLDFGKIRDENGNLVQLTHGNRSQYTESTNRKVRKEAALAYQKPYHQLRHTFAATLNSFIDSENALAELRNYPSARAAALGRNQIDETVYDNLIKTVNAHLDLAHRWYALKKKYLKLDHFYQYDIPTPLAGTDILKTSYEDGKKMVLKAMQVLGDEYVTGLKEEFANRWVDVAENKGKRSGGYQISVYQANPFILLNWTDKLYSTFVLAHESGHAMHSWFSQHHQPSEYADAPIFLAEVASTFNENILTDWLLKNYDDPKVQLYVLEQSIDGFIGTIYRQTQFAEFEHQAYMTQQAGQTLTADYLDQVNEKLLKKYYGPAVELTGTLTQSWAYVPHFYMNYYVYQYATSWAISTSLAASVLAEESGAKERYLAFLSAGGSATPAQILKQAGIDITNTEYLERALKVFEHRLDQVEALLAKVDNGSAVN
ncbi:oligoendopeptidase F [Lactobacillus sp. 3B(2020)]|uniref:oligoendopeptidase F n=1 Tax=Lactobacillus sp. 3B(2020) TaxID=2695882 RepID=UPI0015DF6F3A|nr:oligoendopeptidase F [Lactobacillus sp. 3B(2020)]QLL70887.1 oligoendopeptidase F [Lactobacillus sp. 3B(2020)]